MLPSPNPEVIPPAVTYLQGVACTTTSSCLAVGVAGNPANLLPLGLRWNGETWRIVATRIA